MPNLEKIFFDLARFHSVTPSDGGSIDYIIRLLKPYGFKFEQKIFGNDKYKVNNLYARLGSNAPNICFAGHVDVVDPGPLELWKFNPFAPTKYRGKIFARGAVDMKGAIAASFAASLDFIDKYKNFGGSISFLLTSDEEGDGIFGTREMIKSLSAKGELIDLVILGEPTSDKEIGDQMKIGRRGSINFNLEINGIQGHVAYPKKALNPIHILVKIANDLTNLKLDDPTEFFEPSNLEITSIDVQNLMSNVIPEKATARFNIRFNELQNSESLINIVKNIIEKYTKDYYLENKPFAEVFIQEKKGIFKKVQSIVKNSINVDAKFSTSGGTSDARFIYKYYPVLEIGLKADKAHKINESVEVRDLQKLYKVYYDCLCELLGKQ